MWSRKDELATLMCTPRRLDELAVGFLRAEGFISSLADIHALTVSKSRGCVDVWVKYRLSKPPGHPTITSGCCSEMVRKAAGMRVPIIISRTSPTSLSVEMARAYNLTMLEGQARAT